MIGNDTCFCFTITQSKIIAKDLEKGQYNDSILAQMECEVEALKKQKFTNDTATVVLQNKIANQDQIITNQTEAVQKVTNKLQASEKKVRKQVWQKRLFVITTFIFLGFTILK
ncbi:MAG TPA: hypothetical protein VLB84_02720 [Bacteroidia bacterium]|nr:hypothetical protein [Bacteroidia bacterium]